MATKANADAVHDAEEESTSYTTEMLIAHAAPLGAVWAFAIVADSRNDPGLLDAFGATAGTTLVLTPPIVHAAHGNWGRGAASLGINMAAWIPGFLTMMLGVSQHCDNADMLASKCDYRVFKKTAVIHTCFSGLATFADLAMADVGSIEPKRTVRQPKIQGGLEAVRGGLMIGARGVF